MKSFNDEKPLVPESLVPRLGEILVREHLIDQRQLQLALEKQAQLASEGRWTLLGQVLIELGLIGRDTLDGVITRQILQLHVALEKNNRTLEKRVEERTQELVSALERLGELNQLKASFISSVSHELRMPMQFILGYVDLLSSEALGPLTGEQSAAMDSLQRASKRLRALIENLLQFSSMTSSNVPVDLGPLSLPAPMQEAVRHAMPKARQRNVFLSTDIPPDTPLVQADGARISWVVTQLLDNAVKFTPSGGRVDVRTDSSSGKVTVAVHDTGIGIPTERLHEIFQPFHQLDGSTTRSYQGMGLGLAMAQCIVEAHGSSILVNSQQGHGSCFAFTLPQWKS